MDKKAEVPPKNTNIVIAINGIVRDKYPYPFSPRAAISSRVQLAVQYLDSEATWLMNADTVLLLATVFSEGHATSWFI